MESYRPFRPDPVDEIIKTMMNNRLEDIIYDAATAPSLCSEIAADIRKKIMKLQFDRYKLNFVYCLQYFEIRFQTKIHYLFNFLDIKLW